MEEQIQFAPERRKGDEAARFGRGEARLGGAGRLNRRNITPNEMAAWKLNQALEKYPNFTKEAREDAQNEFVDMPGLRTMNMKLFATTLDFLKSINNQPTPDSFRDDVIIPHMSQLVNVEKINQEETRRLIIRFKAQMLMYIRAIQIFRED